MKLGVLFSGGKDSCYACYEIMKKESVVCLISVRSKNKESYMFHTPNISLTEMQAEAMELPLILQETLGEKERELEDLKTAVERGKEEYRVEGIVTGAIRSEYQRSRIERLCSTLNLTCLNPLWQMNEVTLLKKMVVAGFKTIITGVFAYPFDESWLGKEIDENTIQKLKKLQRKHQINPSGEGGEIETFVYDGPIFKKRIEIRNADTSYANYAGTYTIKDARLVEK